MKIISGRNGAAAQAKLAWLQSLEPTRKKHVLEPVRTFIVRWHKTPDRRVDSAKSRAFGCADAVIDWCNKTGRQNGRSP